MDINNSLGHNSLKAAPQQNNNILSLSEDESNDFMEALQQADDGKKPALLNSLKKGESMTFRNTSANAYFTNLDGLDNLV